MKKFLLFLFTTSILVSCSSDDSSVNSNSPYSPPSWIHGTWGYDYSDSDLNFSVFRFTSDDVCQLPVSCWKGQIKEYPGVYTGSDSSTDFTYEASFGSVEGGTTLTYSFEKISDTKILWISDYSTDVELVKLD